MTITLCPDNCLGYDSKFISLTHRERSTPQKHYSSASDNHFCSRLYKSHGLAQPKNSVNFEVSWRLGTVKFRCVAYCPNHGATACPQNLETIPLCGSRHCFNVMRCGQVRNCSFPARCQLFPTRAYTRLYRKYDTSAVYAQFCV